MKVDGDGIVIRRLYEMLEGQMAVLSSGALSARESAALLDALRSSRLYRADQNSYVLYPDRKLPGFFEKNNIPAEANRAIEDAGGDDRTRRPPHRGSGCEWRGSLQRGLPEFRAVERGARRR